VAVQQPPSSSELPAPRVAGRTPRFRVLVVASEAAPWAKTGGLADVLGALPGALTTLGHDVTVVLPRYRGVQPPDGGVVSTRSVRLGGSYLEVSFHEAQLASGVRTVFVDIPSLFDRDGFYGDARGDFADNAMRFGYFSAAALDFAERDEVRRPFDVVHAHDWQAGLLALMARGDPARWPRLSRAAYVFTIHNLAYQGLFPRDVVPALGLPWSAFTVDTGEFWGKFSFLKTGLTSADFLTTVSQTYARETQTPEFGSGMQGVLSARASRYVGILNGIDTEAWNPATDPFLPAHFDVTNLQGKRLCKRALLERFGLPVGDDALARPLVGLVSRLVEQKGIDLVADASAELVALDASWVFVGRGEPRFEKFLKELAARHPARVGVLIGFDEAVAHQVEAGADIFLMPSRFEPCGLNQMYSLRYGTVPIVHAVGGLEDTIQPYTARAQRANGFKFAEPTVDALVKTVRQATRLYRSRDAWLPLMRRGMTIDHSWQTSAKEYVKVYRRAREQAAARSGR
jgi:starch synthase